MSVQRRGAGAPQDLGILEHFCKMDSLSLVNPPPAASPPRKQSTEPAQGFSQEAVTC